MLCSRLTYSSAVVSFLQVLLAMQGEMSATVVRYPRSWTSLVSRLKNDIVTLRDDADQLMPNLKVGGEWWAARSASITSWSAAGY